MPNNQTTILLPKSMKIINTLSDKKKKMLNDVWEASWKLEHDMWVDCFDVHRYYPKKEISLGLINSIGGSFIRDSARGTNTNSAYGLTLLGILACPSFHAQVKPVISIMKYIKEIKQSALFPIKLSDQQISEITKSSDANLEMIEQFFSRCSEIHSLIHRGHEFWYVNKRDIVNDLRSTDTANNFLDSIASRKYDPDDPVHKADRDKQYFSSAFVEKNELLYLIVRYLSIDKELYKKAEMSANFLMIILRIGISGTIGVILQIFAQNFLYSSVAILISFLLIGGLVSIEQHFWGKSTKWKNKKAMKKYRKKVAKAHERLLTDHIFLRNSAISQIEALRDEFDIGYALSYREDELLEADIEILLSPPHRNC